MTANPHRVWLSRIAPPEAAVAIYAPVATASVRYQRAALAVRRGDERGLSVAEVAQHDAASRCVHAIVYPLAHGRLRGHVPPYGCALADAVSARIVAVQSSKRVMVVVLG
jgi:hypothetical protein